MSDFIVEQKDGVLRVTINHPERGNAMNFISRMPARAFYDKVDHIRR